LYKDEKEKTKNIPYSNNNDYDCAESERKVLKLYKDWNIDRHL